MSKERELLKRVFDTQHTLSVHIAYEIEELLTKPEQTKQEPVAWMQDSDALYVLEEKNSLRGYVIPLYTAPPKREPIEDGELEVWYSQHTWAMDKQEYMWGFRDAEKAHGILE